MAYAIDVGRDGVLAPASRLVGTIASDDKVLHRVERSRYEFEVAFKTALFKDCGPTFGVWRAPKCRSCKTMVASRDIVVPVFFSDSI